MACLKPVHSSVDETGERVYQVGSTVDPGVQTRSLGTWWDNLAGPPNYDQIATDEPDELDEPGEVASAAPVRTPAQEPDIVRAAGPAQPVHTRAPRSHRDDAPGYQIVPPWLFMLVTALAVAAGVTAMFLFLGQRDDIAGQRRLPASTVTATTTVTSSARTVTKTAPPRTVTSTQRVSAPVRTTTVTSVPPASTMTATQTVTQTETTTAPAPATATVTQTVYSNG